VTCLKTQFAGTHSVGTNTDLQKNQIYRAANIDVLPDVTPLTVVC